MFLRYVKILEALALASIVHAKFIPFKAFPVSTSLPEPGARSDECTAWARLPWSKTMTLPKQFGASLVLRIDPLTDDRLERAWFNRGNFSKVDNFLHKLRSPQGLNLTVVVLGGSMTKGENTAVSWSSYFSRSLRRQYPHAPPIRVHNLAMGGSSSVKCLQMQLQTLREADKEHGIDLIVVEYALNDGFIDDTSALLATEGLISTLSTELKSQPALIWYETFGVPMNDVDAAIHCDKYLYDGSYVRHKYFCSHFYHVQDVHALAAVPAGIPIVSYRDVAWPAFDEVEALETFPAFWSASPHPFEVTHALIADVLHYAIQQRANELCSEKLIQVKTDIRSDHSLKKILPTFTSIVSGAEQANDHLLASGGLNRLWFSHGGDFWSSRLNRFLRQVQQCPSMMTIGIISGLAGDSEGNDWRILLQQYLRGAFGRECVQVKYIYLESGAGSGSGLSLRDESYAFHSSENAADVILQNKEGKKSFAVDLIIVELAAADGINAAANDSRVVKATGNLISAVSEMKDTALLYFDTFAVANEKYASKNCGNERLLSRPGLCSAFYYASINHNQETLRKGVPVVSLQFGVWPLLHSPPPVAFAPSSFRVRRAGIATHTTNALFLSEAIREKVEVLGGNLSRSNDNRRSRFQELDQGSLGSCPNKFALSYSPFSNPSIEAAGRVGAIQSWKYYEDRPQKPGWIFEGRPNSTSSATLTFPIRYYGKNTPPLITLGFLRSYGCFCQLQVWVGDTDPWETGDNLDSCGTTIDGRWNDKISLYQSVTFIPRSKCLTGLVMESRQLHVALHVRPVVKISGGEPSACPEMKFKLEYIGCCPSMASNNFQ